MQLSDIRRDGGTQMRDAISETTAQSYAEHLQDGAEFPPVIIFHDGSDYWLADGFHRCKAYELAGINDVPADVRSGSRIEAVRYALKANATNGRPRTGDDMRRAYDVAVRNELCEATDSESVKELLGCSLRWARSLTQAARTEAKAQRDAEIMRLAEQGKTQREIAEEVGVTQPTVGTVISDKKRNSSEIYQPPAPADDYDKAIQAEAKRIEARRNEEKKAKRAADIQSQKEAIEASAKEPVPFKDKKYDVIAIDPPWNYGREYDPEGSRVANPYPEMNQQELLKLELPFKDNSVCFLWTTHAFIWDAKQLLDQWGFTYKATLVWDKDMIGMGAWLRMQCEFCLVGIKGRPFFQNTKWRDIIREKRREHSRKPELFYELVQDVTAGARLDFFSRQRRNGWDSYGNDADKFTGD